MDIQQIISIVVFVIVMALIVTEKLHRTPAAVLGAVILLITGVLSIEESIEHVDFNTLGVLLGMMLFVGVVKASGLFEFVAIKAAKWAKGSPAKIMIAFMIITAVFSAMLDNVTTVLLIAPMTLTITRKMNVDPIPFLLSQAMASNVGGTATLIGDPPNIMIGSAAGLTFADFINNDGLPIIFILAATILCMYIVYGRKMVVSESDRMKIMALDENDAVEDWALLKKSVVMIVIVALGFSFHGQLGLESSIIALSAAIIMIVIGRQSVEDTIYSVEWPTILFFFFLFIVVGGMVQTGVIKMLAEVLINATTGRPVMTMIVLLWASAIISSILDNIPFVATLIPLVQLMGDSGMDVTALWWAISLGACLGGNGTLIGASANVVIVSISDKNGYPISFARFFKVGFPVMIMTIVLASVYMLIRYA